MLFVSTYVRIAAALLTGCVFLCGCENDPKSIPDLRDKRVALEEGKSILSYYSQDGKVKAKLTAPIMYRYQADSSYVEFPNTLHVDFYNDTLKKESQLDARYGKYREWENKVFLKDSVVVMNIMKGDTLRCEELWWDQNKQKFYTDKRVRIYQKDKTIYGKGLEAPQDFSSFLVLEGYGTAQVPKDSLQ